MFWFDKNEIKSQNIKVWCYAPKYKIKSGQTFSLSISDSLSLVSSPRKLVNNLQKNRLLNSSIGSVAGESRASERWMCLIILKIFVKIELSDGK